MYGAAQRERFLSRGHRSIGPCDMRKRCALSKNLPLTQLVHCLQLLLAKISSPHDLLSDRILAQSAQEDGLVLSLFAKHLIDINQHLFKIPESVEPRGTGKMGGDEHISKTEKRIVGLSGLIVKSIQAETA